MPENKRMSHRQMLVFLFRDGLWHTMQEVQAAGGWRYSARILELRKAGYMIETRRDGDDIFSYRWVRKPGQMRLL